MFHTSDLHEAASDSLRTAPGKSRHAGTPRERVGYTPGMDPAARIDAPLREYRRLLDATFGSRLSSMRLFGSRARGDADEDSDADVLVVVDGLTEAERTTAIDLAFDAWRNTGCAGPLLSPLVWSPAEQEARRRAERRIALDIDREGIPL